MFFLLVDPRDENHKYLEHIDFSVPRRARYVHSAWKRHQDAVFWVDIDLAIREGLTFYQTRIHHRTEKPVVRCDASHEQGHEQTMLSEVNMDFRIPSQSLVSGNRAAASSSSDLVFERSDGQATRRLEKESLRDDKKDADDPLEDFQDKPGRHRNACTCTQFSGIRLGTSYESGNKNLEAQHLFSLPERPKLRRLLENQNNKGLFAEDALGKLYFGQKSLVTW